jgi:hypothetical protein
MWHFLEANSSVEHLKRSSSSKKSQFGFFRMDCEGLSVRFPPGHVNKRRGRGRGVRSPQKHRFLLRFDSSRLEESSVQNGERATTDLYYEFDLFFGAAGSGGAPQESVSRDANVKVGAAVYPPNQY